MDPYKILKEAIKEVPFVKYALGVVGIVAAIAIAKSLLSELSIYIPIVFTLVLLAMVILYVLSREASRQNVKIPFLIIIYSVTVLFCGLLIMGFFIIVFEMPYPVGHYISSYSENNNSVNNAKEGVGTTRHVLPSNNNEISDKSIFKNDIPDSLKMFYGSKNNEIWLGNYREQDDFSSVIKPVSQKENKFFPNILSDIKPLYIQLRQTDYAFDNGMFEIEVHYPGKRIIELEHNLHDFIDISHEYYPDSTWYLNTDFYFIPDGYYFHVGEYDFENDDIPEIIISYGTKKSHSARYHIYKYFPPESLDYLNENSWVRILNHDVVVNHAVLEKNTIFFRVGGQGSAFVYALLGSRFRLLGEEHRDYHEF